MTLTDGAGRRVVLGEQMESGRIEPGTSKLYFGTFTIPMLMDGEWALGVEANVDRGVLEGANTGNNTHVSTNTVTVANPAVDAAGGAVSLGAGATKLVRVTGELEEGDALWVDVTEGTGPVVAWGANGAVPTEGRHWTCAPAAPGGAVVSVGGVYDAEATYLLLKNGGNAAVEVSLEREAGGAEMVATGLERSEVTAGPMVGVSVVGVGLKGATKLELWQGETVAAVGAGLVASSGKVSAVFDLSGAEAGEYTVKATDGAGRTAMSPETLRVLVLPAASGELEFYLSMPGSVRDGRTYKGQVCFRNIGNADMEAPIFKIHDKLGQTKTSASPNGPFGMKGSLLTGHGPGSPWSVLKAGEEGKVDFWFTVMNGYKMEVRWIKGGHADTAGWLERMAAEEERQLAAEEAAAEKEAEWEATGAQQVADYVAANKVETIVPAKGGVSGVLKDAATGEPVAGAAVRLEAVGAVFAEAETDENGTFVLDEIWPLGTYTLAAEGWAVESGATIEVTGGVEGVEATARKLTRVTGTLTAGGEGVEDTGIQATSEGGAWAECTSGEGGAFDLGWLADGTWTVRSGGTEGYVGAVSEVEIAGEGAKEITLEMTAGVRWEGRVVDEDEEGVEGVEIAVCDAEGVVQQSVTSGEDGAFAFAAVPEGALRVASMSPEWKVGQGIEEITPEAAGEGIVAGDVAVAKSPLLRAFPERGPAPLAVQFDLTEAGEAVGAVAWAWDFDGDGEVDSEDEAPVWEFTAAGTYSPSVTLTREDGTSEAATLADGVAVRERLATVYQDDVIVLLEGDAAKSGDWEFVAWDGETGTLQVRQVGETPEIALAAGTTKFIFAVDGEEQYRMKVATEVEGPDGDVWTVKTADAAGLTAIYKTLDWSTSTVEAGGGAGTTGRRDGRRSGLQSGSFGNSFNKTWGSGDNHGSFQASYSGNAFAEVQVDGDVVKTRSGVDITMTQTGRVRGSGQASAGLGYERQLIHDTFNIGGFPLTISGDVFLNANAMVGVSGEHGHAMTFHQRIESDERGTRGSTDFKSDPSLNRMEMTGNASMECGFKLGVTGKTPYGPIGLSGQVGFEGNARGSVGSSGADFRATGTPKFSGGINVPLDGLKNAALAFVGAKTAEWTAPFQQFAGNATRAGNDLVADLAYDQQLLNESIQKLGPALKGGNFAAGLEGAVKQEIADQVNLGDFVGMTTDMIYDSDVFQRVVNGLPSSGDLSALRQRLASDGAAIQQQVLNGDVAKEAANRAMGLYESKQYVEKETKSAIQQAGQTVEETKSDLGSFDIGSSARPRAAKRSSGGAGGVTQMPNEISNAVATFGDGGSQSLYEGANTLDHTYSKAGYYLTEIKVERKALSVAPQYFITQVQDWDLQGEGFPVAAKAALVAAADAAGASGISMGTDVWGGYNGDEVPLGLKVLGGLNPVDWDSSGEGLIDDDWKLKMGLHPVNAGADDNPDGDGLSNWQEYQGESPDEEASTQSRRAARRGSGPNHAAGNATHPLKDDTDGGGVADGDELLWGTDPTNPDDDKQPCTGCQKAECECEEDCECEGCEECMPEDEEDDESKKSNDPNEIVGMLGAGDPETERLVARGQELEYTIYFENKEDAEASAQEVWVEMQLDPGVDWSTFRAGWVAVGETWDEGLEGKANWTSEVAMAEGPYRVRSQVSCDPATGKVEWYLRVVDPEGSFNEWPDDPYAGMLPPNDPKTHCGEGALTYKVNVREDAAVGSVVASSATITFDYNEPIVTDPSWWNKVASALYKVKFVNENGRVLKKATPYAAGTPAEEIVQPAEPTKSARGAYRYEFAGWEPELAAVTADATYRATYRTVLNVQTVTFDGNGGTPETQEQEYAADGKYSPLPKASRAGYAFAGWWTAAVGGTQVTAADAVTAEEARTLYAHWRGNPSVITINPNGGKAGTKKVKAYYGEKVPAVAKAPTRTGYILLGIYSAKKGGTAFWNGDMKPLRNWTGTKAAYTFYARWKKSTTTVVRFDANGGRVGTRSVTATYGAPMPAAKAPTRTGFVFQGYYTKKSGGTQFYTAKMASARKWSGKKRSQTLYAHWKRRTSKVTIDWHGGLPAKTTVTATYGSALPKLSLSTRKGYDLVGVYTKTSGGTKYWNGNGTGARKWTATGAAYMFHARWKLKQAVITLDPAGGTGGTASVTATYGRAMPAAQAPTRKGYRFLGYFTSATGGTQYYTAKMASARNWNGTGKKYTFHAQWEKVATLTLNAAGGSNGTAKVTATVGKPMPAATAPERAGYAFLGYFTAATGGTQYYTATMGSARNWNGSGNSYTFHAQWARQTVITLDANGGSNGTVQVTAVAGRAMPAAVAPVRSGYEFLGIFDQKARGTQYYTATMDSARDWNGSGTACTFHAQWVLAGLEPEAGVVAFNGPVVDGTGDLDVGWAAVDGDEETAWQGEGDGGEWNLALTFEAPREVGGVELVEGDTTSEDVALTLSEDGETFQVWDGISAATIRQLLLTFTDTNGVPPSLQEVLLLPQD
ncbi:MAG: InlB B-repeat-containing protein [Kiritimatiellae bacterium]|nr:InlB B-repeat-containing protein [Kiritimatiellia bacterium]